MNIYDISQLAGVSIATVSRVINGSDRVSARTRQKVLRVIEENGYTPNAFARGLGLNTMHTVGLLCADSSDPYLAQAVYNLEQELRLNGYDCLLCCTGYARETKEKYLDLLLSKRVDGLIFVGSQFTESAPATSAACRGDASAAGASAADFRNNRPPLSIAAAARLPEENYRWRRCLSDRLRIGVL